MKDLLQELDARIRNLEGLPYPQVRDEIFAVLQLIDGLHRPALRKLAERLRVAGLWESTLEDEELSVLFTLYDLTPLDEQSQAEVALEAVRPYIQSHGGEVEILEVTDGEVHLRLRGSCESCVASAATLQNGVEAALREGYPGFQRLVVHAPLVPLRGDASLVPLRGNEPVAQEDSQSDLVQLHAPVFRDLLALSDLADRPLMIVESEEKSVLVVRIGDEVYAFDPSCPTCGSSLDGASLSGFVFVCPLGNCAYDARNGRRIDGEEGPALQIYPVTTQHGRVLLAGSVRPAVLLG